MMWSLKLLIDEQPFLASSSLARLCLFSFPERERLDFFLCVCDVKFHGLRVEGLFDSFVVRM